MRLRSPLAVTIGSQRGGWRRARVRAISTDPHTVLALGAALVGLAEYGYRTRGAPYGVDPNPAWLLLEAAIALASLLYAWRAQGRLRLPLVLAVGLAFHACWLLLHVHLSVPGDGDPGVYEVQGAALLDGQYPRSEYPPGAVLLFAFEGLLSDPESVNRFVMVPLQLATVWAVWSLGTRYSPWLAAVLALWPMNTFFWEFRFDLAPAALLAVGLLLAYRERWGWGGVALGIGTAVKWTPALAFAALAVWCLSVRRTNVAVRLGGGFVAGLLVIYVPFLAWSPGALWAAYTQQAGRSITGESLWYLPLRLFGAVAPVPDFAAISASPPRWADIVAVAVQTLVVLGVIAMAALTRERPAAVAAAALAPAIFLTTNRIFSPQFLLVMAVAWAIAGALLARSRREQLVIGLAVMAASLANAFVYPYVLWDRDATWEVCSAALFVTALGISGWVAVRVWLSSRRPRPAAHRPLRLAAS
jgi:hypothetical protein